MHLADKGQNGGEPAVLEGFQEQLLEVIKENKSKEDWVFPSLAPQELSQKTFSKEVTVELMLQTLRKIQR